jgi:hypothetical protein
MAWAIRFAGRDMYCIIIILERRSGPLLCVDDDRTSVSGVQTSAWGSPSCVLRSTTRNTKHCVTISKSIDLPPIPRSSRRMTGCLSGACSLPDLFSPATMASGPIGIEKEVIGQHIAVNASHVRTPVSFPGGSLGGP